MELYKQKAGGGKDLILLNDYCPNPAMKNEIQTQFFDLKIHHMEIVEKKLMGYVIEERAQYLIIDMTITNISGRPFRMYQDDLLIRCDQMEAYEAEEAFGLNGQFPDEYTLLPGEQRKGKLVFIIPKKVKKFALCYSEYFDDDTVGKSYHMKYRFNGNERL
ncbi:DUF4352 domain-containing protein [Massilicoli timonensis]|uniref:DUF4352 domain-containing protein n=1 Tax=Massilicoli timonensis TaxID=2015901 RepID=A0ABT1SHX8_9FIRM|nr:DUF4352 domain-containing protein [Massilicoli timonensis]MCQ5120827.1 DUF4352 domain-containing protein [Massilicoli timonensis]